MAGTSPVRRRSGLAALATSNHKAPRKKKKKTFRLVDANGSVGATRCETDVDSLTTGVGDITPINQRERRRRGG